MRITRPPAMTDKALHIFITGLMVIAMTSVTAGDLERRQAKRMHDRLAGVPPSGTVLDAMEDELIAGNN